MKLTVKLDTIDTFTGTRMVRTIVDRRVHLQFRTTFLHGWLTAAILASSTQTLELGKIKVLIIFKFAVFLNVEQCTMPLGMESGEIPDSDITASSSFDSFMVGAHIGR